jgi:LmbE family N-acetylglucosaminyl deacetylase
VSAAFEHVIAIAKSAQSTGVVTHAYEGGHPDHDTCSYIAAQVARTLAIEVWEMPLYHRAGGHINLQRFVEGQAELKLTPTDAEYARKKEIASQYVSQGDVIRAFPALEEKFRRQPAYDYSRPPHPGQLNYEAWQWPISGADVSKALTTTPGGHS